MRRLYMYVLNVGCSQIEVTPPEPTISHLNIQMQIINPKLATSRFSAPATGSERTGAPSHPSGDEPRQQHALLMPSLAWSSSRAKSRECCCECCCRCNAAREHRKCVRAPFENAHLLLFDSCASQPALVAASQ